MNCTLLPYTDHDSEPAEMILICRLNGKKKYAITVLNSCTTVTVKCTHQREANLFVDWKSFWHKLQKSRCSVNVRARLKKHTFILCLYSELALSQSSHAALIWQSQQSREIVLKGGRYEPYSSMKTHLNLFSQTWVTTRTPQSFVSFFLGKLAEVF